MPRLRRAGGGCSVESDPAPGKPAVTCRPAAPAVSQAPRRPIDRLAPLLLKVDAQPAPGESYTDVILRLVEMEGACALKISCNGSGRPIPVATMPLTANPPRRLSSVPSDYASRKELWIRSGLWLSFNEGPFVEATDRDHLLCPSPAASDLALPTQCDSAASATSNSACATRSAPATSPTTSAAFGRRRAIPREKT